MKLVEVVMPIGVAPETVETAFAVCRKMGKAPVKTKDTPGFIVNRLLGPLYMEAAQMVLEGTATAEDIDTAMKLGAGHPMGPCELADFGGFDVIQMAQDAVFAYTHSEATGSTSSTARCWKRAASASRTARGFTTTCPTGRRNHSRFSDRSVKK